MFNRTIVNFKNISKKIVSKLNIKDIVKEISSIPNITSEEIMSLTNIVIDKLLVAINSEIQELLSSNQNITEEEVISKINVDDIVKNIVKDFFKKSSLIFQRE